MGEVDWGGWIGEVDGVGTWGGGWGMLDSDDFEDVMTEVFGRGLDSELMSQLALAFSSIIRLGKDEESFRTVSPKIFGSDLSSGEQGLLFVVSSHCAAMSPLYRRSDCSPDVSRIQMIHFHIEIGLLHFLPTLTSWESC